LAVIKGITPGDNFDAIRKVAGFESTPAEPDAPLPTDHAELSRDRKKISAEDMRKASIEYYPLHKKRRAEAALKAEELARTLDGALSSPKKAAENPKVITVLPESPDMSAEKPGYNVDSFLKKMEADLGPLAKNQNAWDIQGLEGKIPTLSELQASLERVKQDKSVPWEYIIDGCYARAHVTCEKLLNEGVNCAKLFAIIGDAHPEDPTYPFPSYRLKAENKFMKAEWWYHVAPLVFAKDDKTGEIDGYIVDLAMNNKQPIKAADWIKSCWSGDFPIVFDATYADVYDPPEQEYTPDNDQFSQERFDKWLPEARQTNKEYSAALKPIKDDYYAHHPDEKPGDGRRS
jgi:hypothetical protein